MQYRIIDNADDERLLVTEDGGFAVIRTAEEEDGNGRIATIDLYQARITDEKSEDEIIDALANKVYYEDFTMDQCSGVYDETLVEFALDWLNPSIKFSDWVKVDNIYTHIWSVPNSDSNITVEITEEDIRMFRSLLNGSEPFEWTYSDQYGKSVNITFIAGE
jgi:hypothetical protein